MNKFKVWRIGKSKGTMLTGDYEFVDGEDTRPVLVCPVSDYHRMALIANRYRLAVIFLSFTVTVLSISYIIAVYKLYSIGQ